ncbi:hypothetical protein [Scytonema sp. NUACC26]|uniref:hypothetical protein n=1 Tax=Scytonema sp. NUACC26 TaxID=3140176 RepID=UPI0034DBB1DB
MQPTCNHRFQPGLFATINSVFEDYVLKRLRVAVLPLAFEECNSRASVGSSCPLNSDLISLLFGIELFRQAPHIVAVPG